MEGMGALAISFLIGIMILIVAVSLTNRTTRKIGEGTITKIKQEATKALRKWQTPRAYDELTPFEIDHLLKALRSFYDKEGGSEWCSCCEEAERKLEDLLNNKPKGQGE